MTLNKKVLISTSGALMLAALFAGCASYPHSTEKTVTVSNSPLNSATGNSTMKRSPDYELR